MTRTERLAKRIAARLRLSPDDTERLLEFIASGAPILLLEGHALSRRDVERMA